MRFKNRIKYIVFFSIILFFPIFLLNPCTAQFGVFSRIPDYSFKIPSQYIPYGRIFNGPFGTYSGLNNSNTFYGGYYRRPGFNYPFYNGYFDINGYYGVSNYGLYGGYGGYALPFSNSIPFAGNGYGFPSYGSISIYDINRLPYPNTSNAARPTQPTGFVYCPSEYEPIGGK